VHGKKKDERKASALLSLGQVEKKTAECGLLCLRFTE
jgi:hypothetical protein